MLSLPAEVRNEIYGYVLEVPENPKYVVSSQDPLGVAKTKPLRRLALLSTCHQTYYETAPLPFRNAKSTITSMDTFKHLPTLKLATMTKLHLCLSYTEAGKVIRQLEELEIQGKSLANVLPCVKVVILHLHRHQLREKPTHDGGPSANKIRALKKWFADGGDVTVAVNKLNPCWAHVAT